ncbi:MAG: hypothetical protein AAGH70_00070 [Pseudomonadota bacterium]
MATDPDLEGLQAELIELVFTLELTPQGATARAVRDHPNVPLITWVFALTTIATDLRGAFEHEAHWTYTDWIEAAASLGCDIYALDALGRARPRGRDLALLWNSDDPHLT